MPKHTFYKTDAGRYLLQTRESPVDYCKQLYAVWRGPIDNLQEDIITVKELRINRPVSPAKVPVDWHNALAAASGLFLEREPPPPHHEPPAEQFVRPYSMNDLIAERKRNPEPLLFEWGPYWVMLVLVILFSFLFGASP